MKKHITIGLTTALLALPSTVLAEHGGTSIETGIRTELYGGNVNTAGKLDVKVQQVKGEMHKESDASAGKGGKGEARAQKNVDGGTIKGEAKIKGEAHASSTKKERKNYGWGFLSKWFGSHEAGPVGIDASATPGMNAPASSRLDSLIGRLSSMFSINFNAKVKATTTAEVK